MFFLNGIVSQMTIDIAGIIVELFATSSKISLLVPISLDISTVRCNQSIAANIKFPVFVK